MGQPLTIINELDKTINVSWRPILLVADPNEEYTINAQDYVAHTAKATLYEVTITYLLGKQPFKH